MYTYTTFEVASHTIDYTGLLCISKTLRYTIGESNFAQCHSTYCTEHKLKLPSLTQLGDPANKNMRFEINISGSGTNTTKSKATIIRTAGELFELIEHKKPRMVYSYYADVGVCAKNVRMSIRGESIDDYVNRTNKMK